MVPPAVFPPEVKMYYDLRHGKSEFSLIVQRDDAARETEIIFPLSNETKGEKWTS